MDFQQTIFLTNANSAASSKSKNQSALKASDSGEFYKIIQSMSSSAKDNGSRRINTANTSSGSVSQAKTESSRTSSDADIAAGISDMNDLIDENVINEAIGAKSSGTQTEKVGGGEAKFSAEDLKAIASDRQTLEEISAALNIPIEVIDAFISQLTLQAMGDETVLGDIPAIIDAAVSPNDTAEPADPSLKEGVSESLKDEFIERLKEFADMSENDKTAQKYSDLNEFVSAVTKGLELNDAAGTFIKPDRLMYNFANAVNPAEPADETTEFVTDRILSYLNIDADCLSDFEIVSIEKTLNENVTENDNFTSLLQKLRSPLTALQQLRGVNDASVTENAVVTETETPELIPVGVNAAETENNADNAGEGKIEAAETYVPASRADEDGGNIGLVSGNISEAPAEINQYPDVITHYTRAANSIQNLILNNKSGENFQVKMLLRPEGLGEMLVRVTYNKGNINLNITTDNSLAQRELISQATELRNTLAEHNFSLMNFDVGNKNPDDRNQYGDGQEKNKNKNGASKISGINTDADGNINISSEDIIRLKNIYFNRKVYRQV